MWLLIIIALLLMTPFIEIYLIYTFSLEFGFLTVITLAIITAVIGGIILRWQGTQALAQLRSDMRENQAPIAPVADGVFLILAVPLLMTPGFLTDAFGFMLLIPPLRQLLARMTLRKIQQGIKSGNVKVNSFDQFDPYD